MRTDYATWEETFMGIAEVAAQRSKDPRTQVGACIVSPDNRILSIGYNGTPNGFHDNSFPWAREGDFLDTKYAFVVHAERNAVLNFRGNLREFTGSTVYVTHFPCNECAKELAQVSVKKVVYKHRTSQDDAMAASRKIFDAVGIQYEQYTGNEMSSNTGLVVQEDDEELEVTQSVKVDKGILGNFDLDMIVYPDKTKRSLLKITESNYGSEEFRNVMFAYSDLMNRSDYFLLNGTKILTSGLRIVLTFGGDYVSELEFEFFIGEYVDIETWERFKSWHHVEKNAPIRLTLV